jgi:hypothetical protein
MFAPYMARRRCRRAAQVEQVLERDRNAVQRPAVVSRRQFPVGGARLLLAEEALAADAG